MDGGPDECQLESADPLVEATGRAEKRCHARARLDEGVEEDAIRIAPNSGELLGHPSTTSCEIFSAAIKTLGPEVQEFGAFSWCMIVEVAREDEPGRLPSRARHLYLRSSFQAPRPWVAA